MNSDLFRLDGKVALVTGASYGIGMAMAKALAGAGATIVFNDRNPERVTTAMTDYRRDGIDARGYLFDVTDENAVRENIAAITAEVGVIDILVNNAGIIIRVPALEMEVAEFREVIDIDLTGPFIMSKAVAPGMIEKGGGKIINICSMMSELGRETVSATPPPREG